jgi:hypothetical protein
MSGSRRVSRRHFLSTAAVAAGAALSWIEPAAQPLTFRSIGQSQPITLEPLYKVIRERYAVYWKVQGGRA